MKQAKKSVGYYLLQLDPAAEKLSITGFSKEALPEAQAKYADAEQVVQKNPGTDAVFVSVDSLALLERAYPNYFADTRMFAQLMNRALTGQKRGISVPPLKIVATSSLPVERG